MSERIIPNAAALRGWRKSSYSSQQADSCVEILDNHPAGVPIRDSKNPCGPALVFPVSAWSGLLSAARDGHLSR
ncbi:DUF397 domain-containing protein [Streptomyces sp. DSM 44917]|uniref:DUF397 domain-containing protein n=1 Tax=Streptomyces boetiae TaxID=3075541 RepID=A0ABU2LFD6_9ACTN|nr:DUF397 domain-containing protein [Streptomyces sp. DSM 44917]MDT0310304.1 DUF397 domain-containing protein [Streptomyces sp. DSM 44917]